MTIAAGMLVTLLPLLAACAGTPPPDAGAIPTVSPGTSASATATSTGGKGVQPVPDVSVGGGSPGGVPGLGGMPPSESPSDSSAEDELEQHLADCARQIDSRQLGQVQYPRSLPVQLGGTATYEASLDIRPGADQQPAPGPDTQVAVVEVRCGIGARLVERGRSITVEDEGEWFYRQFDSPGVFEWAWAVRATTPEDGQVRLEFRPAVAVSGGGYVVPGNDDPRAPVVGYESVIDVQAGLVDQADSFASESWPKIARIGAIAAAAVLGVVAFSWRLRRGVRGEDGDVSPRPASAAAPRRGPPRATATSAGGRRRTRRQHQGRH